MPRLCPVDDRLAAVIASQDFVVHRDQALSLGLTADAVRHRIRSGQWQGLLPHVYLTHVGEPSRRQMLGAALLYAGEDAAIDDVDACRFHGVKAVAIDDRRVHVVVPQHSNVRSYGFVRIRRTTSAIVTVDTARIRYLALAPALIAATRRMRTDNRALAILADGVQRKLVTFDELIAAHVQGPQRNARLTDDALEQIAAGVRSTTEGDFRVLAEASLVLPPLLYNCVLRLPTGEHISPDALALDAGLVHETNGRKAHARSDLFEDTMVRHTLMTTAGLVVVHNSGTRVIRRGRDVIAQFERCHDLHAQRGMPAGIEIVKLGFEGQPSPALSRELERWGGTAWWAFGGVAPHAGLAAGRPHSPLPAVIIADERCSSTGSSR
jgi:hypothetical protein